MNNEVRKLDSFSYSSWGGLAADVCRHGESAESGHTKGKDLQSFLQISYDEAVNGCEKAITVEAGDVKRDMTLKIPEGIGLECRGIIRVEGEGMPSPDCGPNGDLYVNVKVEGVSYGWNYA